MTNKEIVILLKRAAKEKGVPLTFVSEKTEIGYQRLQRIFNQGAMLSASEFLKVCTLLDVNPDTFAIATKSTAYTNRSDYQRNERRIEEGMRSAEKEMPGRKPRLFLF